MTTMPDDENEFADIEATMCEVTGLTVEELRDLKEQYKAEGKNAYDLLELIHNEAEKRGFRLDYK